ncbi:MAG: hypothetical protein NT062_04830 [Proteobacteria bacterium]|nr:hypothetical protein [Pseudomonadota bacterium]
MTGPIPEYDLPRLLARLADDAIQTIRRPTGDFDGDFVLAKRPASVAARDPTRTRQAVDPTAFQPNQ